MDNKTVTRRGPAATAAELLNTAAGFTAADADVRQVVATRAIGYALLAIADQLADLTDASSDIGGQLSDVYDAVDDVAELAGRGRLGGASLGRVLRSLRTCLAGDAR